MSSSQGGKVRAIVAAAVAANDSQQQKKTKNAALGVRPTIAKKSKKPAKRTFPRAAILRLCVAGGSLRNRRSELDAVNANAVRFVTHVGALAAENAHTRGESTVGAAAVRRALREALPGVFFAGYGNKMTRTPKKKTDEPAK